MKFSEYIRNKDRMCHIVDNCKDCPFNEIRCRDDTYPEKAEQILEKWLKEHPIKTNKEKFKEIFGDDFPMNFNNYPCSEIDCDGLACIDCIYYDIWNKEYIERGNNENQ